MEKRPLTESRPISTADLEVHVRGIALPNQLPKGVDFTDIPAAQLKSSTLEILITQNEDLMARLSIALRKNHELEERINALTQENQNLRSRFDTLKEQFLVYQEKDRLSGTRSAELHEQNQIQKQRIYKLEKMYADVFIQAQAFQRQLQRLERYRARVRKAGHSIHASLSENKHLKARTEQLASDQIKTIAAYEARLGEVRDQLDTFRDKAVERDRVYGEKLKLENNLVFERRQYEARQADAQERLNALELEVGDLRRQLKETLIDREAKQQELNEASTLIPNLQSERTRLLEQVESLQALWSHKQQELEAFEEKNRALQKLNQTVSVTLSQQRKEIHLLKNELEKERFTSSEHVKTLMQEIQLLRSQIKESGSGAS